MLVCGLGSTVKAEDAVPKERLVPLTVIVLVYILLVLLSLYTQTNLLLSKKAKPVLGKLDDTTALKSVEASTVGTVPDTLIKCASD
jgi:hypothetical protein